MSRHGEVGHIARFIWEEYDVSSATRGVTLRNRMPWRRAGSELAEKLLCGSLQSLVLMHCMRTGPQENGM